MRVFHSGFEASNTTFPEFDEVSGAVALETTAPLYGRASAKFDQSAVQYLGKSFPYTPVVPGSWHGFHFKASVIAASGLVQWLTGTSSRGDLRFNAASSKLELRVNGSLVKTGNKTFLADRLYHAQLYLVVNAAYQQIQVKVDNDIVLGLDYFSATGASPPHYDKFRWGSFLGGGTGTLLIDDIWLNDSNPWTGGDFDYPGRLAITDEGPTAEGAGITNEFSVTGAANVPAALAELGQDGDTSYASTTVNRERHSLVFASPEQPVGGVLESVGFNVVARAPSVPTGYEVKSLLLFRSNETPVNEVQTITISSGVAGDEWVISYKYVNSAIMAYNASLATVQAQADIIFGASGVVVSGTPGSSYVFTFAAQWSQTKMLILQLGGNLVGSGRIAVARTTAGAGIQETGVPFGYFPPESELPNDVFTSAYPEALTTAYQARYAHRRAALDGGAWTKEKADAVELVIRAQLLL